MGTPDQGGETPPAGSHPVGQRAEPGRYQRHTARKRGQRAGLHRLLGGHPRPGPPRKPRHAGVVRGGLRSRAL